MTRKSINMFLNKNKLRSILPIITLLISLCGYTQNGEIVSFDSDRWEIDGTYEIVDYLDKTAIHFEDGGKAILKNALFQDGEIEFDIAYSQIRTFIGFNFRMADEQNYEDFYVRPHQSGNPDAVQYQPTFNDQGSWQLFSGEGYSNAVELQFDRWVHVKCIVSGTTATIYFDDMENPILEVPQLKNRNIAGMLALWGEEGYFADFKYSRKNPVTITATETEYTPGTVKGWSVSNSFSEEELRGLINLSGFDKKKLTWQRLDAESSGLTVISKTNQISEETNSAFLRVTIHSEKKQVKKMNFGFSDRIAIFLNDIIIYSGNDQFRSRDYRFLGTIGYYDDVYLTLNKGDNDLWMAISETFGGWGAQGKFDDLNGIEVKIE